MALAEKHGASGDGTVESEDGSACPKCGAELERVHVSLTEDMRICSDDKCMYPFCSSSISLEPSALVDQSDDARATILEPVAPWPAAPHFVPAVMVPGDSGVTIPQNRSEGETLGEGAPVLVWPRAAGRTGAAMVYPVPENYPIRTWGTFDREAQAAEPEALASKPTIKLPTTFLEHRPE